MDKLDKLKNVGNNISNTITGVIELDPSEVMKKIFDNIVWVIVLTTLLFLAIMAYLSIMRFNVNYKLDSMDTHQKHS